MHFFIRMDPPTVTHQEKKIAVRNGKPVVYEGEDLKKARRDLLELVYVHRPAEPMQGPVKLMVKWCFEPGRRKAPSWKVTKPDTDNLDKLLKDVMTDAGFWNDDAQVVQEMIEKAWARPAGIYIDVREADHIG